MALIAFFLGRPGSGKTTAFHTVSNFMQHRGWTVTRIREYAILQQMFHNDLDHKRFRPVAHGGFDVIDFSVLDEALQLLEQQINDYLRYATEREFIVVEFARDNYRTALQPLSPAFLQKIHILYMEAGLDTCIKRIEHRVRANKREDNHYVSANILRDYYGYDNRTFMQTEMWHNEALRNSDISYQQVIRFIDNNGSLTHLRGEVEKFLRAILDQGHRYTLDRTQRQSDDTDILVSYKNYNH